MHPQPRIITIIASLVIVFSLVSLVIMLLTGVAIDVHSRNHAAIIIAIVGNGTQLIIGLALLKGKFWARQLFFWLVGALVLAGVTYGVFTNKIAPGTWLRLIYYSIFTIYLAGPVATRYFNRDRSNLHDS